MVYVVAELGIREDAREAYMEFAKEMVEETNKEEGCIMYEACVRNDNPLVFGFIEKWESKEALDAHMATAHMAKFRAQTAPLRSAEATISFYGPF